MNISANQDSLIPYQGGLSLRIPARNGNLGFVDAEESTFLWAKALGYQREKLTEPSSVVGELEIFSNLNGAVMRYKVLGGDHDAAGAIDEATLLRFLENR